VVAGKTHAPSCLLEGDGLSRAVAHAPADILVTARDAAGNVNTRGGDKLTLSLVSRPGSHVHIRTQVLDERNGRYIVRYTPSASGPLHLQA